MKLKNYYLGDPNGEEEARDENFIDNYYVNIEFLKQALSPKICVILGRQGSGKTLLSHYIIQKFRNSEDFTTRISFGSLITSSLAPIDVKIAETDYFHLFEWTFLVELSKLILEDNSINNEKIDPLKAILLYITQNFSIHKKTINNILTSGIELSSPLLGGIKFNKTVDKNNLAVVTEELKILIAELLRETDNRFLLFIDDIDDHLTTSENDIKILNGMVNAVYRLNFFIRDNNKKSKVTLLLRSDMFYKLTSANINKISESHSLKLEWPRTYNWLQNTLSYMIAQKIRNSNKEEFSDNSDLIILLVMFDKEVFPKGKPPQRLGKFLYSRTFFRPREVIKYLNIAQNKYPDISRFSGEAILNSERPYSYWLKKEIEVEMGTHYSQAEVKELIDLIIFFNKKFLLYSEMKNLLERKKRNLIHFSLEDALKILFKFGVLHQSYKVMRDGKTTERHFLKSDISNFTDQIEHPNFLHNNFHLHEGLVKSFLTANPNVN